MLKKLGLGILVFGFLFVGANYASATEGLTLGAGTVAGTETLTLTGAVDSAIALGSTTTTGAIGIGAALTSGALTLGKSGQTGQTTIYGGGTGAATAINGVQINVPLAGTTATSGESHGLDVVTSGTVSTAGQLVGANVVLTASGASGLWESALYAKIVQPTSQALANGYTSAAEFEVANANTSAMNSMYPLVLDSNNAAAGYQPASAFIWAHNFGTAVMPNLFDIDTTIAAGAMVSAVVDSDGITTSHTLKIMINGTSYYIPLSSSAALD